MTVTTKQYAQQEQAAELFFETAPSAEVIEQSVLTYLNRALDTTSDTHQLFYGDPGVVGVERTPLHEVTQPASGCRVLLKDETEHQYVSDGAVEYVPAFKRRGAWLAVIEEKLANPRIREATAASSGNHAKALVAASKQLGMTATIFMAETSDPSKQATLRDLGAALDTNSSNLSTALELSQEYAAASEDRVFVHPYDDYRVIAGQATAAVEVLDDLLTRHDSGDIDLAKNRVLIAVPLGGGGFATATGIVFKLARDQGLIGENVRVLAVEPENKSTNALCDGTMAQTGVKASVLLHDNRYVQGVVTVRDEEIGEAMAWLHDATGKKVEPAGALAASLATIGLARDTDVLVAMVSGASVSDEKFEHCMELAESLGYMTARKRATSLGDFATRVTSGTRVWNGR